MILAAIGSDDVVTSNAAATVASPQATVKVDGENLYGEHFWCLTKPYTQLQI